MWQGLEGQVVQCSEQGRGVSTRNERRTWMQIVRQCVGGDANRARSTEREGAFCWLRQPGPAHAASASRRQGVAGRRARLLLRELKVRELQSAWPPAQRQLSASSSGLCDVAPPQLGAQPVHLNHQPVAHRHLQAQQAGGRAHMQAERGRATGVSGRSRGGRRG